MCILKHLFQATNPSWQAAEIFSPACPGQNILHCSEWDTSILWPSNVIWHFRQEDSKSGRLLLSNDKRMLQAGEHHSTAASQKKATSASVCEDPRPNNGSKSPVCTDPAVVVCLMDEKFSLHSSLSMLKYKTSSGFKLGSHGFIITCNLFFQYKVSDRCY